MHIQVRECWLLYTGQRQLASLPEDEGFCLLLTKIRWLLNLSSQRIYRFFNCLKNLMNSLLEITLQSNWFFRFLPNLWVWISVSWSPLPHFWNGYC